MNKKNAKQVIGGATLSYILIILNAIYGLVLTPFILSSIGDVEYGVYRTIGSLSSSLMVIDLGLGATVTRYIAKFISENREDKIPNFMAIILLETSVIIIMLSIISLILYLKIPEIYSQTFSTEQIILAQRLFILLCINMGCTILENVINGTITGCNDFLFGNGIKLLQLIVKILLIILLLRVFPSSIALVSINLLLTMVGLFIEILWAYKRHNIHVRYEKWDSSLFSESFVYTLLMFASSVINQVNSNLDNVVIGAVIGASAVTVYSMGLTIYAMFEQLSTSISGVMLPSMIDTLAENNGLQKAEKLVIRVGRVQFALLGATLAAFIILGQEFIRLWLGTGFEDVYAITLILMIPSVFSLSVNVCLSILRAKNLLGFRTIVLLLTTFANAIITYFGTKAFGYFAACIGTSFSLIVGVILIMNLYYHKKFGFDMIDVYRKIFSKIWIAILFACGIIFISSRIINGSWFAFIINAIIFCCFYALFLFRFGLNDKEKYEIKSIIKKGRCVRYFEEK